MSCCLALILLVVFPVIGAIVLALAAVGLMAALVLAAAYCMAIFVVALVRAFSSGSR